MTEGTTGTSGAVPGVATEEAVARPSHLLGLDRPMPRVGASGADRRGSWVPTWPLITTKLLELRRRRGLMLVVLLLTLGLPFLVLGFRLLFHAVDPKTYGPAGSPGIFQGLSNPMAEFGFIIAAALGATAGTTDLNEGVFRHLVITGRSRLALYLARIPSGLAIVLPLVGVAFAGLCLVTTFEGVPQPTTVNENGASVPLHLDQSQLETWLLQHPQQAAEAFVGPVHIKIGPGGITNVTPPTTPQVRSMVRRDIAAIYQQYSSDEVSELNPVVNEMVKVGLWIELEVAIGFVVGLGLGSLTGQRTLSTIVLVVLEIILTPILANTVIPYFIDGQRLVVGVAMTQLRPEALGGGVGGGHAGRAILGGRALGIPPMPTWAMVTVIVGWIVGWSVIGAWRMVTRDA